MPLQPMLVGEAHAPHPPRGGHARARGANELATYFVGQVVGQHEHACSPTRRVVLEMVEEFIDAVERLEPLRRELIPA